jgi:hypothetical protein
MKVIPIYNFKQFEPATRRVLGPKDLPISIPVSISTSPAGANVNFENCSTAAGPGAPVVVSRTVPGFDTGFCNGSPILNIAYINCPAMTTPISCGLRVLAEYDEEDAVFCTVDVAGNRCVITADRDGSGCGSHQANCVCIAN